MQRLYSSSEAWPSQVWKLQIKSSCIHAKNFRFQTTAHYRQGRIQTSVMLLVMFCVSDNDKRHQCLEDCGIWLHVTSENANDSTATTHNWSATRHFKQDIAHMAARGYAPTDSWMYILYQVFMITNSIQYCLLFYFAEEGSCTSTFHLPWCNVTNICIICVRSHFTSNLFIRTFY